MKRFKSKKRRKISLFKITFFIMLTLFFYYFFTSILFKFKLSSSNQEFLNYIIGDTNHYTNEKQPLNLSNILKQIFNIDTSSTNKILESTFGYSYNDEIFNDEQIGIKSEYVYDPNPIKVSEPIVYIYNTHQLESYSGYTGNNITPNVLMAAYTMKEKLNKEGIPTIIETANITEYLNINNWNYYQSYNASRHFLEQTIKEYPNLKLVIDLHRDAIEKNASTVTINDKEYAKILFVVGTEYENYEQNLTLANNLNNLIKNKYPNLTRGIITKSGSNVNGIYNQDLTKNAILIECGGYQNTFEEVTNTIDILVNIIKEYLK